MDPVEADRKRQVTFVMAYAIPTLGMERSALRLLNAISHSRPTRLVLAQGPAPQLDASVEIEVLCQQGTSRGHAAARLASWGRAQDPGVFVVVGTWTAVPWLLSTGSRHSTIVWEHSLIKEKISTARRLRLLAHIAQFAYRRARAVVAVSEPLAEDVRQLTGTEAVVIPNIIEEPEADRTNREVRHGGLKLLCVGSLTHTKRQAIAIDALALSPAPDCELHIVGDGPLRSELETHAAASGVADRVYFHGHLSEERVLAAMRDSDVLIHPSAGETFGMVFMEAAACGLPIIANRTPVSEKMIPLYAPGTLFDGSAESLSDLINAETISTLLATADEALERRQLEFSQEPVTTAWQDLLSRLW